MQKQHARLGHVRDVVAARIHLSTLIRRKLCCLATPFCDSRATKINLDGFLTHL
jgi:hypothetical protein